MPKDLRNYDIVIAIDKSGSMSKRDCRGGKSRWQYVQETAGALARKAEEIDNDGITVVLFGSSVHVSENVTSAKVEQIFSEHEPGGSTDTAAALSAALNTRKDKPLLIVVLTDGEPDDKQAVEAVIVNATQNLSDNGDGDTGDLGILFLQVGHDSDASAWLRKLDDELADAKFDVVDAKTVDEIGDTPILEVLQGTLDD